MMDATTHEHDTTPEATRHGRMGWPRKVVLGLVLGLVMATSTTACNRYGWELFRGAATIAAYVAVTAAVLSWHDHHHHSYHCGHRYVVYESRPVYHYEGRWEYYDPHARTWYYYPDGVPY
jgi:hypothetical protein